MSVLLSALLTISCANHGDELKLARPENHPVSFSWAENPLLYSASFPNPTHGWAVGHDGAILVTVDGGASWQRQDSGTKEHLLSVQFLDTAHGWAVGLGGSILATVDGGDSWTQQSSQSGYGLVMVHFLDTAHGWALGHGGVVLATADGGTTWVEKNPDQNMSFDFVYFVSANTGWAGNSLEFLKTVDGGATWSLVPDSPVLISSVNYLSRAHALAIAEGKLVATGDGGTTWSSRHFEIDANLHSMHFLDDAHGWAVGQGGTILATADGGVTWLRQSSGVAQDIHYVHFFSSREGWAIGPDVDLTTPDGGETWISRARRDVMSRVQGHVSSVELEPRGQIRERLRERLLSLPRGLATAESQGVERFARFPPRLMDADAYGCMISDDVMLSNSFTLRLRHDVIRAGSALRSVFFHSVDHGWAVGDDGIILATIDGGTTWSRRPFNINFMNFKEVHFPTPSAGWIVGSFGLILVTMDGGITWTPQSSGTEVSLKSVHFVNTSHGWAVGGVGPEGDSIILGTTDGGFTWVRQKFGAGASFRSVHSVSEVRGWIVGKDGVILSTMDGGATWIRQSSGTITSLNSVYFHDVNRGWVAGDDGVILATVDGGTTWVRQESGTDDSLDSVSFRNASRGLVVGGSSVISTFDGGATWHSRKVGTNEDFQSVHFFSPRQACIVGSFGRIFLSKAHRAPFVETFRPEADHARLSWTVESDQDPDSVRCALEFRVGSSARWFKIHEGLAPIGIEGKQTRFVASWRPASEDYRVQPGDDLHYRITLSDAMHTAVAQEIPERYRYQSLAERRVRQWDTLGQRPFGKVLQGAILLVLLGGLYVWVLFLVLFVRPSGLLWLTRIPVGKIVQESGAARWVGLALEILVTVTLGRYFARHRRTRQAWIRRFRDERSTFAELEPGIRRHYFDQTDVLDAWVEQHAERVHEALLAQDTVKKRGIHVPMPVQLGERTLVQLAAEDLRSAFGQRGCLTIWGEGGTGKTSLACQIARWALADDPQERLARHRILPVLLEPGFAFEEEGENPLREVIRGQLEDAVGLTAPIPPDLLERLLRHRRVLVVLDSFSEMDESTRQAIAPAHPAFAAHALVITSRRREDHRVRSTTLKPLVVKGPRLLSFLEAYFARSGKQNLFNDAEVYGACQRLAQMVGDRATTILFARLFADQMIADREAGKELDLPDTLPDLMLSYLNSLIEKVEREPRQIRALHGAAKVVAWECLRPGFRPSPARLEVVLEALGGEEQGKALLGFLEHRLGIVRTVQPGEDRIRFTLDPLTEFLAGLHLVEAWAGEETRWRDFLRSAERVDGAPETIREFLLAVRDCCRAKGTEHEVPDWVATALGALAVGPSFAKSSED